MKLLITRAILFAMLLMATGISALQYLYPVEDGTPMPWPEGYLVLMVAAIAAAFLVVSVTDRWNAPHDPRPKWSPHHRPPFTGVEVLQEGRGIEGPR